MQIHLVKFNENLYMQVQGLTIGVSVAGNVVDHFLTWWNRKLKQDLEER